MTNEKEYAQPGVSTLTTGRDVDWSSSFLKAVEKAGTKYLLILIEDYFLLKPPDQAFLKPALGFMKEKEASYLRLFPRPGADNIIGEINGCKLGEVLKQSDYRVSLQAAIWEADYIKKLVKPGESAWEFEVEGSRRSNDIAANLYSVVDEEQAPLSYLCTAVVKGYWTKKAVRLCQQHNAPINLNTRKVEPFYIRKNMKFIIELIDLKNKLFNKSGDGCRNPFHNHCF